MTNYHLRLNMVDQHQKPTWVWFDDDDDQIQSPKWITFDAVDLETVVVSHVGPRRVRFSFFIRGVQRTAERKINLLFSCPPQFWRHGTVRTFWEPNPIITTRLHWALGSIR